MLRDRESAIFCGLFLSKFGRAGLEWLGLGSYKEAYTIFGLAFGVAPASIKHYRDEFDAVCPNKRKGWHGRRMRDYVASVYERLGDIDLFSAVFELAETARFEIPLNVIEAKTQKKLAHTRQTNVGQRTITGRAAEQYFVKNYREHAVFEQCSLVDVTPCGCGFDFRMETPDAGEFFAVEVKGLNAAKGQVQMTEKEHATAEKFGRDYFLYVVTNFQGTPKPMIYRNPIGTELKFRRRTVTSKVTYFTFPV